MQVTQRDIRSFQARYHRNGICGEGFHACQFVFIDGKTLINMRAIVFDGPGQVAITSDDITSRWRGDHFEDAIRAAIKAVEQAQPEVLYS